MDTFTFTEVSRSRHVKLVGYFRRFRSVKRSWINFEKRTVGFALKLHFSYNDVIYCLTNYYII